MTIYDVRVTKQFHVTPVFLSWYLLCSTFTFVSRSEDDLTNQNIKKNVGVCGRTRERGQKEERKYRLPAEIRQKSV